MLTVMHPISACNQLFATVELVELILEYVALDDLLRCRQVSSTWRDLVKRSKLLQRIREYPYVGVLVRCPRECSLSEGETLTAEADLTLWHDRPVTILRSPSCLTFPCGMFFKVEEGATPPENASMFTWPARFNPRAFRFNHKTAVQWITLFPGRPMSISWRFRSDPVLVQSGFRCPISGDMTGVEVGKRYILKLRSSMSLRAYTGIKEQLVTELAEGDKKAKSLRRFRVSGGLPLVAEDEAHFMVVP
jgi:hypothetical protein